MACGSMSAAGSVGMGVGTGVAVAAARVERVLASARVMPPVHVPATVRKISSAAASMPSSFCGW